MTQPFHDATPETRRVGFVDDFKRFFLRGLAAIMPTLITLWLLVWVWNFLWDNIGIYLITLIRVAWFRAGLHNWVPFQSVQYIMYKTDPKDFSTRLIGVGLAILLVYCIGVFVGNLLGRTMWIIAERWLLRIPFIRAIYPAVKQITDFILSDRSNQFAGSRVVAVQPHEQNIWSIGLVTGSSQWSLADARPETMITVFVPSTPTSFSGYVLIVPRARVVELPMTVEEAMRLLISGGVIMPANWPAAQLQQPVDAMGEAEPAPRA